MATSKPEFQGVVLKEASSNNYCGLYRRRLVNVSGAGTTQFYWLPTNKSGDIMDYRVNLMNGTFSTDTAAIENKPANYGDFVDRWPTIKHLSYMNLYPFDNEVLYNQSIDEWARGDTGISNIVIPIFLGDVFDSWDGIGKKQVDNNPTSWVNYDRIIDYAKSTGKTISLKIVLSLGGKDRYDDIQHFWTHNNTERDEWQYPIAVGDYWDGHPSLADKGAGSGRSMMIDFFQKAVERYGARLGAQINWISYSITAQMEYGYNYENRYTAGSDFPALSGYSDKTKAGFRTWLASQYSNNINTLNSAWGASYGNFGEINPPVTGLAPGIAETSDFAALFYTNKGKDWWKYRSWLLYDFSADCGAIISAYSSAKHVLSFGGVSPNDPLCVMRGTYDVTKWGELSDGMKTAFGVDNRNNTTAMTLDYVQNYTGKIITELHYIDFNKNGATISGMKDNMIASGKASIMNGCKDLMFISMPQHGEALYRMMKEVFQAVRGEMQQNYDNARQTINKSTDFNLGELLSSGGYTGLYKWAGVGGSNTDRVNISFTGSVNEGTNDYPYTMSLIDNQLYYLRQNEIKNSAYGRLNDYKDPIYTDIQQNYNATRVPFLVSSHGITNIEGAKTKSTIEIVDSNGVKWVKMVQSFGVTKTEQDYKYSNNHPEFRFGSTAPEDCRFWLPKNAAYYDIIITVFDARCLFEVYHADDKTPDRIIRSMYVNPGETRSIRFTNAEYQQENVNQRVIKINNNRWNDA